MSRMSSHYLYVIGRADGPVKVGVSSDPKSRLATLQTGCPFRLDVLHREPMRSRDHALLHEKWFHEVYEDARLTGEWFDLPADEAIERVNDAVDLEAHSRRPR